MSTLKRENVDDKTSKPTIKRNKSLINDAIGAPTLAQPTADDATVLVPDLEDCGFEDFELPKAGALSHCGCKILMRFIVSMA
jgi:hypothetical protein